MFILDAVREYIGNEQKLLNNVQICMKIQNLIFQHKRFNNMCLFNLYTLYYDVQKKQSSSSDPGMILPFVTIWSFTHS